MERHAPYQQAVEKRLGKLLKSKRREAATPEAAEMIQLLEQLVLRAGKRSRPRLLKLTYDAYGGNQPELLVDIGVTLELQHQFLLVHDDIMDNDVIRYDGPNMLGYYRERFPADKTNIADSMALMAGNLLFTYACQVILDHPGLSAYQKVAILSLIQEANLKVHTGQQLDVVNVLALQPTITLDKLLQTDTLKTASYSVQLPMQTAAVLLGLKPAERQLIDDFGEAFGVFYQLADDYADYFTSDSSFESHPKHRDYRQGKITYPLLYALEHASAKDTAFLREHAGHKDLPDSAMKHVTAILQAAGAQVASKAQVDNYYDQASTALRQLHIQPSEQTKLAGLLASFKL